MFLSIHLNVEQSFLRHFLKIYFIYFWLCWVFTAVCGLLTAVPSLVEEHGL